MRRYRHTDPYVLLKRYHVRENDQRSFIFDRDTPDDYLGRRRSWLPSKRVLAAIERAIRTGVPVARF